MNQPQGQTEQVEQVVSTRTLSTALNTAQSICPKCTRELPAPLNACPYCGLIFAKYLRAQAEREARLQGEREVSESRETREASAPSRVGGRAIEIVHQAFGKHGTDSASAHELSPKRERQMGFLAMKAHAQFFQRVGKMIQAGSPLPMALERAGRARGEIGRLVDLTLEGLNRGLALTQAFELAEPPWPSYVWGHLEAGLASGMLDQMFLRLGEEIERRRQWILAQIFNWRSLYFFAMLFFSGFSLAVTGAVASLQTQEVEKGQAAVVQSLIEGAVPRFLAYLLVFASILLCFAYFQIQGKQRLTSAYPAFERLRLRLPLFSKVLIRETLARYLHLFGSLLDAGLPLYRALEIARSDIEFPEWRRSFHQVREKVERGAQLSDAFAAVPHLPSDLIAELAVGERTGELGAGMLHFERQLVEEAKQLRQVVNLVFLMATILVGILLTVAVAAKGMNAIFSTLERVIGG